MFSQKPYTRRNEIRKLGVAGAKIQSSQITHRKENIW
jgi:hypothetical protein